MKLGTLISGPGWNNKLFPGFQKETFGRRKGVKKEWGKNLGTLQGPLKPGS